MSIEKKNLLPMNIQFFAEQNDPQNDPVNDPTHEPSNDPAHEQEETIESLKEQLAKALSQSNAHKKAFDEASKDAANWKKQYRAKMTEEEKANAIKAEQEEATQKEIKELRRENELNKLSKRLLGMGYTEKQATDAATAKLDGDDDEYFRIQLEVQTNTKNQAVNDYMKSQPAPPTGGNPDQSKASEYARNIAKTVSDSKASESILNHYR